MPVILTLILSFSRGEKELNGYHRAHYLLFSIVTVHFFRSAPYRMAGITLSIVG